MKSIRIFQDKEHGIPYFQKFWFIIISTVAFVSYAVFENLPDRDLSQMWNDLTNGSPKRGQAGLGKFIIYGETSPFEYPWRLASRFMWSALTPWLCFIPHQIGQFYIIYKAREAKIKGDLEWTGSDNWNPYAWNMFILNTVFIILHYFQTKYFYDGLAQTFTEMGTLMICCGLIMAPFMFEIKRRGLFFGWTPKAFKPSLTEFAGFAKTYHGYLCSFGMTLTFWYHPMESTFSHWTGFTHIILLFWQSSLLYQKSHRNRYWTFFLEFLIFIHGTVVAYYQGLLNGKLYLMFFTGFILAMLSSQIWGLPIVRKFVTGSERGDIVFNWKYWTVVITSVAPWFIWTVSEYYSNGVMYLMGMPFGIPMTYYIITAYFFWCYSVAKNAEYWVVTYLGVKRDSKLWYAILGLFGAVSCAILMGGSELIYRMFVPYSKPVPPLLN